MSRSCPSQYNHASQSADSSILCTLTGACAHVRCGGSDASVYVQVEAREEARAAVRELLLQREADALQARRHASVNLQVHLV